MKENQEVKAFGELKGNTLQVYLYLVKKQMPVGAREVQRELNFSSPTLAVYHLEKLENLGLVQKSTEGYGLTKEVKVGVLSQIIKFGSLLLPRYVFYLGLFSSMLLIYFVYLISINQLELNIHSSFAVLLGFSIIITMIYECIRIWKQKI